MSTLQLTTWQILLSHRKTILYISRLLFCTGSTCWCPNYIVEYWSQRLITLLWYLYLFDYWRRVQIIPTNCLQRDKSGWLSCPLQLNTFWVGWWPSSSGGVQTRARNLRVFVSRIKRITYIARLRSITKTTWAVVIESSCPSLRPFDFLLLLVHQYHKEEPPRCCLPPTQTRTVFTSIISYC